MLVCVYNLVIFVHRLVYRKDTMSYLKTPLNKALEEDINKSIKGMDPFSGYGSIYLVIACAFF